jgi:HAD superfamily hydrolase (TIGR01509 family)
VTTKFPAIRAIVFDLDGVLVDTETVNLRSAVDAFAAFGHELDPADRSSITGWHPDDYVPRIAARVGLDAAVLPRLREFQHARYLELWPVEARIRPGAPEILDDLSASGYRLGLATSAGKVHVARCFERFGIGVHFASILTRDDVSRRKPDPEIYLRSAERLGVRPTAMLVVEDSEPGVRAAVAAGARCVALLTPHTPPERLAAVAATVRSLRELRTRMRAERTA